jgi:hypothetical protein
VKASRSSAPPHEPIAVGRDEEGGQPGSRRCEAKGPDQTELSGAPVSFTLILRSPEPHYLSRDNSKGDNAGACQFAWIGLVGRCEAPSIAAPRLPLSGIKEFTMMRTVRGTAMLAGVLFTPPGCVSEGPTGNTSHLDVTATPSASLCAPASPELQVYGTPRNATHYRVTLIDLSQPAATLGRGEVSVNPDGVIPAGTLTDYTPPCPSAGVSTGGHSYQYQVHAVDDLGHVLGTGAYIVSM